MRKIILSPVFIFVFVLSAELPSAFSAPILKPDVASVSNKQKLLRMKIEIDQLNSISVSLKYSLPQISFSCAQKALEMAKKINYTKAIAEAFINIGNYYLLERNYLSALKYSLLSYDIAKESGNVQIQSQSLAQIGSVYYNVKRVDRCVQYISLALKLAQKSHDTNQIINIYLDFSAPYSDSNNYKIAERYLYNSLYLSLKQHNQLQEAFLYKHLGTLYFRQHAYNKALYYFEKSIEFCIKLNQQLHIGSVYTLIAHIHEQKNDFPLALKFNKIALTYRLANNQDEQIASSLLNIGNIYVKMEQFDSALYYLNAGTAKAELFNKNHLLENGYWNLYELYKKKNNSTVALKYYEKYCSVKDSVDDEVNKRKISILEINRLLIEQEKETSALKNENFIQYLEMKNRNLLVLLLISLTLLTIAVAVYIRQLLIKNKKAKKIVEEMNVQLQDEIHEHVIVNKELSRREQEYRFITEHSADLITLMDSSFKCIYISPSSEFFLGYSPEELEGMEDYRVIIHPDSMKSFGIEFESMMKYHDPTRFIYQAIRKDGSTFWVESNINPIFDPATGKLTAMLSVTRDVSGHVNQEEALMVQSKQQEMLIKEVHHRVKNNLAILTSLVNMQKREFTDLKTLDILSDLDFRVRAMALVHDQLYKSQHIEVLPIREYLSNLVRIVSSAFSGKKVEVHQDFLDEIVDVEITLPLGLIVNELLTNAYKYAFPDSGEGNIWVSYKKARRRKNVAAEMRCLTVKDDGIGLPADYDISEKTTLGKQIIYLLTNQLEGEIKIDGTKGASFSIILPAER